VPSTLWIAPLDPAEGPPRVLLDDGRNKTFPVFTGDGRGLVYTALEGDRRNLFEVATHGGPSQRVTFGEGPDWGCDISPDGKLLLYDLDYTTKQLFAAPVDGSSTRKLSERLEHVSWSAPTPDGREVLAQVRRGGRPRVVAYRVDGGAERVLTDGELPAPTWNGAEVIFTRTLAAGRTAILAMPLAGGAVRPLAEVDGEILSARASLDGWVHFQRDRDGRAAAWRVWLAGGQPEEEAPDPWSLVLPLAGGWVLGTQDATRKEVDYYLMPPGVPLGAPGAHHIRSTFLVTAPDLRSVVYLEERGVVRLDLASGEEHLLVDREAARHRQLGQVSSDGRTFYFTHDTGSVRRLLVTNFADRPPLP
jgi:Tol biopolymer transport system component